MGSKRPVILAVEDNKVQMLSYHQMFGTVKELAAFELVGCENALVAWEWLALNTMTRKPALILLDWMMQGMSGLEFQERLKLDARWSPIPVIMVTSNSHRGEVALACARGVQDYVLKPIRIQTLVQKVVKLAGSPEKKRADSFRGGVA